MSEERNGRGPCKGPRKPILREISTTLLLTFYDACLREDKVSAVAAIMDTTIGTLLDWVRRFPELKEAKEMATRRKKESASLDGYMFRHLSLETKKLWDDLTFWKDDANSEEKFRNVLKGITKTQRQEIYLHALVKTGWNPSSAARIACVPLRTVDGWQREDKNFGELVREMEVHRKNFFEHALVPLARQGNAAAVLFVNRTLNSDRGYNEKIAVQHEHSGTIRHIGYSVKDLNLSLEMRKDLLRAVREKKATEIIDAEEVEPKQLKP
jgi:transposase